MPLSPRLKAFASSVQGIYTQDNPKTLHPHKQISFSSKYFIPKTLHPHFVPKAPNEKLITPRDTTLILQKENIRKCCYSTIQQYSQAIRFRRACRGSYFRSKELVL